MKQSKTRRFTATCVVSAVVIAGALVATPANAAPAVSAAQNELTEAQIASLGAGIDDTRHVFDGKVAVTAGADPATVSEFAAGYQAGGGRLENVTADRDEAQLMDDISIAACKGKNSFDVTGLQANLYINSCNTAQAQKGLLAGAAMATLVGAITAATGGGAAAGAVAAAGLSLGAALLAYYNKGKGVKFYTNPLTTGINSQ